MIVLGFNIIDLAVIAVYLLGITALGMYMAKRVKTVGDFFLGGRKFGKLLTITRDFGIGTSAEDPVIVVGNSYRFGLSGIWYTLVQIFATPFYWITKPWFRRLRIYTTGDLCEMRFGAGFSYFYSVFSTIMLSVMLGIILKSSSAAVVGMSAGQLNQRLVVFVMATLFILYGAFGGQHAAVITDFFQAIFIIILSVLLIPFSIVRAGGIDVIREKIPHEFVSLVSTSADNEITLKFIVMAVTASLLGAMGNPTQGTVISKTEWETRIGMTVGNMLKRLCTVAWAFSGLFYFAVNPNIENTDTVFGQAISEILPIGFVGLMAACLMAAAMSTCDGIMVIAGSYIVENFYKKIKPGKMEKHYLFTSRFVSVAAACGGIFCALAFPSIVDALKYAWVLPTFVGISIWISLAWRRANRWGAWATVFITLITQSLCKFYFELDFASTAMIYIPAGVITMIVVSYLTPREPQEKLDEFYALLHTPVGQEERLKYAEVKILHY